MIWTILIIIFVISFGLSLYSLRQELKKHDTREVRKALSKERVIFHSGLGK